MLALFMMPALFLISSTAVAQTDCEDGETEIYIEISPDQWENEISWTLMVGGELISEGGSNSEILCVELDEIEMIKALLWFKLCLRWLH